MKSALFGVSRAYPKDRPGNLKVGLPEPNFGLFQGPVPGPFQGLFQAPSRTCSRHLPGPYLDPNFDTLGVKVRI